MDRRLAALVVIGCAACGGTVRQRPTWPDAPVELRDEVDREAATDRMWVTPVGPERDQLRTAISDAIVRRLSDAVHEDRPFAAADLLDELTALWQGEPTAIGPALATHTDVLRDLRKVFAKSGALEPAAQTLIVLSETDPPNRTEYLSELDEILAFADDLAIAENGDDAIRSQPLALLQPTALALPLPWLVDRYVKLLVDRQVAVSPLLEHYRTSPPPCTPGDPGCQSSNGVTIELVRAHHDILAPANRIANVLARARRPREIHVQLSKLSGIGTDREVAVRAEVIAEHPTSAEAYGELASVLRTDDHAADPTAALALCTTGLTFDPDDPVLLAAAGNDAHTLGRVDQAIQLYELALRATAELDTTVALRLGKLYGERIARLAASGRPAAANSAWNDVIKFTAKVAKQHPSVVWQQAAAIAESALGKGLASQGFIDAGRRALTASIERAPSSDAYETLTTIDVQVAHYKQAQRWAAAGIAILGDETAGDRYRRAKLERLIADALRETGKPRDAAARYLDSLRTWASVGETKDLPQTIAAERLLDSGRAMWWIGDHDRAIDLIAKAVDFDTSTATASGAVAFLLEVDRYREALDVFHRGLGDPDGSELYKVYTSLWVIGEAIRIGEPRDQLAVAYLASRHGDLWYELLARAASGTLSYDTLRAAATTGPRQAELAFYGAVLRLDPTAATPDGRRKLLERVIGMRTVLDAEFDLARKYLQTIPNTHP